MFIDPEERYFHNANRPISEIYELLPQFRLETTDKEVKFTGDVELLAALQKHVDNANDVVLHGLQSFLELLTENINAEEFTVSSYEWQSILAFVALNINLLQSNLDVKGNISCAKSLH